jgi:hypothetical protein
MNKDGDRKTLEALYDVLTSFVQGRVTNRKEKTP